jgi:hypothetical protein
LDEIIETGKKQDLTPHLEFILNLKLQENIDIAGKENYNSNQYL